TTFLVTSPTTIRPISPLPPYTTLFRSITVTNCAGTSATSSADQFTYTFVNPTVTSLSPNTGPAAGGTPVTITGTGFIAPATVTYVGTLETCIVVTADT